MWLAHLARNAWYLRKSSCATFQDSFPTRPPKAPFLSQLLHRPHTSLQTPDKMLLFWSRHYMTFPVLAGSITVKQVPANLDLWVPEQPDFLLYWLISIITSQEQW